MRRSTRCSRWRWSGSSSLAAEVAALDRRAPRVAEPPLRRRRSPAPARLREPPQAARPSRPGGAAATASRLAATSLMRGSATLAPAGAVEQRHRLEQEPVVVERAPGARQEEAALALGAGERALAELAAVERGAAAGAGVAEGEQVALDPGDDERDPVDLGRRQLALAERLRRRRGRTTTAAPGRAAAATWTTGSSIAPGPGSPAAGAATAPSTTRPSRSGAASSSADLIASSSVDDEAGQPSQLPSSRIRAIAVLDPEQLDVAAVRLHVGADAVERLDDPLGRARPGRGRGSASGWRRRRRRRAARAARARPLGLGDRGEDPLEALAVELDHRADQLLGALARDRVGDSLERRGQPLDALDQLLGGGRARARAGGPAVDRSPPFSPSRRSAHPGRRVHGPCAPCRRRRTCARRTAGTGRSCAPPA